MIAEAHEKEPNCSTCAGVGVPEFLPENREVFRLFPVVKDQVIAMEGHVIGLDLGAVIGVMDVYGVKDRRGCLDALKEMHAYYREILGEE